jgi:hypothetical protein
MSLIKLFLPLIFSSFSFFTQAQAATCEVGLVDVPANFGAYSPDDMQLPINAIAFQTPSCKVVAIGNRVYNTMFHPVIERHSGTQMLDRNPVFPENRSTYVRWYPIYRDNDMNGRIKAIRIGNDKIAVVAHGLSNRRQGISAILLNLEGEIELSTYGEFGFFSSEGIGQQAIRLNDIFFDGANIIARGQFGNGIVEEKLIPIARPFLGGEMPIPANCPKWNGLTDYINGTSFEFQQLSCDKIKVSFRDGWPNHIYEDFDIPMNGSPFHSHPFRESRFYFENDQFIREFIGRDLKIKKRYLMFYQGSTSSICGIWGDNHAHKNLIENSIPTTDPQYLQTCSSLQ